MTRICGLRIADCGFMSLFNRGLEIEIECFINPQSAIRNHEYPFGWARRQRQADSMMLSSSLWRGFQPKSRMILSGLAIKMGGSPARRGAASVEIHCLVTWRAISTTSATE